MKNNGTKHIIPSSLKRKEKLEEKLFNPLAIRPRNEGKEFFPKRNEEEKKNGVKRRRKGPKMTQIPLNRACTRALYKSTRACILAVYLENTGKIHSCVSTTVPATVLSLHYFCYSIRLLNAISKEPERYTSSHFYPCTSTRRCISKFILKMRSELIPRVTRAERKVHRQSFLPVYIYTAVYLDYMVMFFSPCCFLVTAIVLCYSTQRLNEFSKQPERYTGKTQSTRTLAVYLKIHSELHPESYTS